MYSEIVSIKPELYFLKQRRKACLSNIRIVFRKINTFVVKLLMYRDERKVHLQGIFIKIIHSLLKRPYMIIQFKWERLLKSHIMSDVTMTMKMMLERRMKCTDIHLDCVFQDLKDSLAYSWQNLSNFKIPISVGLHLVCTGRLIKRRAKACERLS